MQRARCGARKDFTATFPNRGEAQCEAAQDPVRGLPRWQISECCELTGYLDEAQLEIVAVGYFRGLVSGLDSLDGMDEGGE